MKDDFRDLLLVGAVTFNVVDFVTTMTVFALGPLGISELNPALAIILRLWGIVGFTGAKLIGGTVLMYLVYRASRLFPTVSLSLASTCCLLMVASTVNLVQVFYLTLGPVWGWTI